jgi:MarR family transcriptional regulator, organic hydroperoxide resistance regulator
MGNERTNDPRSWKLPILTDPRGLPLQAWVRVIRARELIGRRLERVFARHGLTTAQFDVLATLQHGDGITQQELSERLLVTKGNVCGLIDRAEAAGWVERRPDPEDRRANRLFMTEQGRARLAETLPDHHAVVEQVLGRLGRGKLQSLQDLLDELIDSAVADEPR